MKQNTTERNAGQVQAQKDHGMRHAGADNKAVEKDFAKNI